MIRASILAIAFAAITGAAALAQFPPQPPPVTGGFGRANEQERAACHPDVVKWCQAELASNADDVFGILGCLQRNRSRIGGACREVLETHGQ